MAFEAFGALDFAAAGNLESFHRASIAFDFGHFILLYVFCNCLCNFELRVSLEILNLELYFGVSSMAMLLPSNLGSMSSLAMSST